MGAWGVKENRLEFLEQASVTIIGVLLTALLAYRVYHAQKEYELLVSRYLDEGLDPIAAELQSAIEAVNHNWARCVNILREYRDLGGKFDEEQLNIGFIERPAGKLQHIANFRVYKIVGNTDFWVLYQLAISDLDTAMNRLSREYPNAVRLVIGKNLDDEARKKATEYVLQESRRRHDSIQKWANLLAELHGLRDFLEGKRLTHSYLRRVNKKKEIKQFVANLKKHFPSELQQHHTPNNGFNTDAGKARAG